MSAIEPEPTVSIACSTWIIR